MGNNIKTNARYDCVTALFIAQVILSITLLSLGEIYELKAFSIAAVIVVYVVLLMIVAIIAYERFSSDF